MCSEGGQDRRGIHVGHCLIKKESPTSTAAQVIGEINRWNQKSTFQVTSEAARKADVGT